MKGNAWQAHAAYFSRRAGVPGWLGILGLLAALAFLMMEAIPASQRLAGMVAQKEAAEKRLAQLTGAQRNADLTPAQRLAAFYGDFPQGAKVPDVLASIYETATAQHLALELGEYALTKAPGGRLDQFRITLPVKGPYPQVRKFAAEVLVAHPSLSLESMSLRREKVADGSVDGRIVFLLFLEHGQ